MIIVLLLMLAVSSIFIGYGACALVNTSKKPKNTEVIKGFPQGHIPQDFKVK